MEKQFFYIVKEEIVTNSCKVGVSSDLEQRLKQYNGTGKSITNLFQCLFAAEVSDMFQVERDFKDTFSVVREKTDREMFLFTDDLIELYANFITEHPAFIKEVFITHMGGNHFGNYKKCNYSNDYQNENESLFFHHLYIAPVA